jgi:uncharacterized protein (DUF2249 family)
MAEKTMEKETVLDVREMPPWERHPLIYSTCHSG